VAEKALTRARMQRIESTLPRLRIGGQALGHYALGRGHLVLHEYAPAEAQLQKAWELGMRAPELHYALGLALGERYRSALLDAQRQTAPSALDRRKQELRAQFLLPALTHLRESSGVRLEAPAYVEGLIAFYNEQPALALQKAEEALRQAPWLPEPKKLMADVHYAKGFALRHEGKYAESRKELKSAVALYQEAEAISRSDADIYVAEAEALAQIVTVDVDDGTNASDDFSNVKNATAKILQSSHDQVKSLHLESIAAVKYGETQFAAGKLAASFFDYSIALMTKAIESEPGNCEFYETIGSAYLMKYYHGLESGDNDELCFASANKNLTKSISCNPNFAWAYNDLAVLHQQRGRIRSLIGEDSSADFAKSTEMLRRVLELIPKEVHGYVNYIQTQKYRISAGVVSELSLESVLADVGKIVKLSEANGVDNSMFRGNLAALNLAMLGMQELYSADYYRYYDEILKQSLLSLKLNSSNYETYQVLAEAHLLMAEAEVARGAGDSVVAAGAQIDEGLVAAQKAISLKADDARSHKLLGQLLALQAAQLGKKARQPAFEAARAAAERAVALNPRDPAHSQALAEVWLRTAQWQRLRHKSLDESIAAGLLATTAALRINPRHPYSFVTRGALLLEQALATRAKPARQATLLAAREALTTAVTHNKLLTKQVAPLLDVVAAQLTPQ